MSSKKVKIGGFMCHSPASTAVCMPEDVRSVIVPHRINGRSTVANHHHAARMISTNDVKYSRLVKYSPLPTHRRHHHQPQVKQQHQQLSPSTSSDVFQVVVLRVSIHCQGCARKVKKHLSRMEGVTSFSIDLETKRVTVMGHISPAGVLESISKVKKAELWPCSLDTKTYGFS